MILLWLRSCVTNIGTKVMAAVPPRNCKTMDAVEERVLVDPNY